MEGLGVGSTNALPSHHDLACCNDDSGRCLGMDERLCARYDGCPVLGEDFAEHGTHKRIGLSDEYPFASVGE